MFSPQEAQTLRQKSGDSAVFTQMLNDPEFKAKYDRVTQGMPDMTEFEKLKLPSTLLDLQFGKKVKSNPASEQNANMLNSAMQPPKQEKGAWDTLTQDPLVFAGQTAKNVLPSTGRLIGGVASMAMHPIETGKSIFQLGVGGAANTIESIASLAGVKNPEDIFDLGSEEVASAVGDFYVQRYGSLESAATTLRDDPAGFFSDFGAVVTGVGGAIKGGATAVGAVSGAATRSSTALTGLGKGLRAAQGIGDSLIKTGVNMEPLVITGRGVVMAGRGVTNGAVAGLKGMAPNAMATKGLKINPSDIRSFQNLAGNELPGDFLIRKGVLAGGDISVGAEGLKMTGMSPIGRTRVGIMTDLERIADKAKNVVDSTLSGVRQTYDVIDDVPVEVPKLMDEILTLANKYDLPEQRTFINNLIAKERITLSELNQLKRVAYDMFNTYKRSNLADDSFRAKQIIGYEQGLRGFIESEAARKGLPDIALLNQDTQKAREILDAMHNADAASWSKGKLTFGLMDGMFGLGTFSITGDFMTTAGIVIGRKVLESTVFKTTFAKYLNRLDPTQINVVKKAFETMKHTKESKQILRKVVAQSADDIKNQRIADMENVTPQPTSAPLSTGSALPEEKVLSSQMDTLPESSLPVNSPLTLPRDGATKVESSLTKLKGLIKDFKMVDEKIVDFDQGVALAAHFKKNAKLLGNVDAMDLPGADNALRRAIEANPNNKNLLDLQGHLRSARNSIDYSGEIDMFESGFKEGLNGIDPEGTSVLMSIDDLASKGAFKYTDVVDFDGTTLQSLVDDYTRILDGKAEKAAATRAASKARIEDTGGLSKAENSGTSKVKQNMFDDFGNLTPEEIANLTPEERATGRIGGSDGGMMTGKFEKLLRNTATNQRSLEPVGKVGDMFKSSEIKNYTKDIADIPVYSVSRAELDGANGVFRVENGKPKILISSKATDLEGTLAEEIVHAKQWASGRVAKRGLSDSGIQSTEDFASSGRTWLSDLMRKETGQVSPSSLKSSPLEPLAAEARKYKSQYEFVSALRKMKTSEAPKSIVEALKELKNKGNITDSLEALWKEATGYIEPVRGKPTPIPGTNINVEDLPF